VATRCLPDGSKAYGGCVRLKASPVLHGPAKTAPKLSTRLAFCGRRRAACAQGRTAGQTSWRCCNSPNVRTRRLRSTVPANWNIRGRLTQFDHPVARNSAEFTLQLSNCRFDERYCWPSRRQQKGLENIRFSRALSGCGDPQPPIPTFACGARYSAWKSTRRRTLLGATQQDCTPATTACSLLACGSPFSGGGTRQRRPRRATQERFATNWYQFCICDIVSMLRMSMHGVRMFTEPVFCRGRHGQESEEGKEDREGSHQDGGKEDLKEKEVGVSAAEKLPPPGRNPGAKRNLSKRSEMSFAAVR
jgi:hypothetical protein